PWITRGATTTGSRPVWATCRPRQRRAAGTGTSATRYGSERENPMSYKPGDIARHEYYGTDKIEGGPRSSSADGIMYVARSEGGVLYLVHHESLTPEPDELPAGTKVRDMRGVKLTVVSGPFGGVARRPWYVVRGPSGLETMACRDRLTVV